MNLNLHRSLSMLALYLIGFTFGTTLLAQELLEPINHPKYIVPLPVPAEIDATAGGTFEISMAETQQWLGLLSPAGDTLKTTVWGYGFPGSVTYPGPTFEVMHGTPVDVLWTNDLPMQHLLPVDTTLHMARPQFGGIPAVVHLHGGHTESASDGLPEAWFTQGFQETGGAFVKELYHYDNDNEASTLWYHDHALGITRLNVYAGLAGFYLMRDVNEEDLRETGVLPDKAYENEIVFQDRMFTSEGSLFLPSAAEEAGWPDPGIRAEFFGDFILVNGVAWPFMQVEPRKYRLRLLNGSDSRFFIIRFGNEMEFWQIGTDNGLLENPVVLEELLLAPGERAEIIIDFSTIAPGTEIICTNRGPDEPFKGLNPDGSLSDGEGGEQEPSNPQSTGMLMKFVVNLPLSSIPDASITPGTTLRPAIVPFDTVGLKVRQLVLFEGEDEFGRLRPQLGILDASSHLNGSLLWEEETTEVVELDDTEIWEIYNATEDAHPIHLHLVAYQILSRQEYDGDVEHVGPDPHTGGTKLELEVEHLEGNPTPPAANEKGWKDTGIMLPRQVTRIAATFDRAGEYVWHCHILSHEDHEMMRRLVVSETSSVDQLARPEVLVLERAYPNPLRDKTQIDFTLREAGDIRVDIYSQEGQKINTLAQGFFPSGRHSISWDGTDYEHLPVPGGVYYCQLQSGAQSGIVKLVVIHFHP